LKTQNLKNKKLIDLLFRSRLFVLQNEIKVSRDNGKEIPPLFCVSVPKKHFRRAVDRNKIRRRVKAALNNINIKIRGSYLIMYRNMKILSYQEIEKTLANIFKQTN
jgi:ribonuclease P protein component